MEREREKEYFIKVAFITRDIHCPHCLYVLICHFSISSSSIFFPCPLFLMLHLLVSLFLSPFSFLLVHLSLPRASILLSLLPLSLFISVIRLLWE